MFIKVYKYNITELVKKKNTGKKEERKRGRGKERGREEKKRNEKGRERKI